MTEPPNYFVLKLSVVTKYVQVVGHENQRHHQTIRHRGEGSILLLRCSPRCLHKAVVPLQKRMAFVPVLHRLHRPPIWAQDIPNVEQQEVRERPPLSVEVQPSTNC